MKKLETKEFFYQTDPADGQIYLHEYDYQIDPRQCGKALLTILVEEPQDEGLGLGHDNAIAEQLLAEGTCPCGRDNHVGCSVTGCPLYLYTKD